MMLQLGIIFFFTMNALRAWLCRDATHFLPAVNAGKLGIVFRQLFLIQPDKPPKTSKELYEILL